MIYTRYLYDKRAVEFSLFIALLKRDRDEALFWTFELYHSGFKTETISLLWRYYYSLYCPFYINLGNYLFKQTQMWLNNKKNDTIVGTLVENLVGCEPCIDFYMIYNKMMSPPNILVDVFAKILSFEKKEDIDVTVNTFISENECFKTRGINVLNKTKDIFKNLDFLDINHYKNASMSLLYTGLFLKDRANKFDPRFYIKLTDDCVKSYKTKKVVELNGWKVAKRECLYKLKLKPNSRIKSMSDYENWVYYASRSPIWKMRIEKYKGTVTQSTHSVSFDDVNNEDAFYNWFNFEPDEQTKTIQDMWMGEMEYDNWEHIYNTYKCEPYNDWVDEINI